MELIFKGSFFRDLDHINNRYVLLALKEKIDTIREAKSPLQISRLKKLRDRNRIWYKIEIQSVYTRKIYWILCIIQDGLVDFRRIKSESFFKKNF